MSERRTGRRLILADGTTIENGEAGYAEGFLWCYFSGMTLAEATGLFLDTSKTERIRFEYGEMADEYEGFTTVRVMRTDADGEVSICLEKGDAQ